jgi:hypothetical protein
MGERKPYLTDLPTFVMPRCVRHYRYRWWCRYCRSEAEGQFRQVCEALWRRQLAERENRAAS